MPRSRRATFGAALARGLVAGAAGTAAMTAWQDAAARLRAAEEDDSGGDAPEPDPWEQAPAPAKVAKVIGVRLLARVPPAEQIPLLTNVMHWSYGSGWGGLYGVVSSRSARRMPLRRGMLFGTAVWAMSYAQLVPLGIYEPPWRYPPGELALDLSYHLVYGVGTAAAAALLQSG